MAEQFPDLQVTIVDSDAANRSLLEDRLYVHGVTFLGALTTAHEVNLSLTELRVDPDAENLISRANLLFINTSPSDHDGMNGGSELVTQFVRDRQIFLPMYYRPGAGAPSLGIAYSCSTDPAEGRNGAIGSFNYDVSRDKTSKLEGMLCMATGLLRQGVNTYL